MMKVDMPPEAAEVWNAKFAHDPRTAELKLTLGAHSYERATKDDTGLLISSFNSIADNLRADLATRNRQLESRVDASLQRNGVDVLKAIENQTTLAQANQKLTKKGIVFESELQDKLSASSGIASASRLTENDARGCKGGDIFVQDHFGASCVLEVKDKQNLTEADLTKFIEDADAWPDASTVFVFLRKEGVGSCRKLQVKPLMERLASGRLLVWYKDSAEKLVDMLPFIMKSCAPPIAQDEPGDELERYRKVVASTTSNMEAVLRNLQTEIGSMEKNLKQRKSQEGQLQQYIREIHVVADSNKKQRIN